MSPIRIHVVSDHRIDDGPGDYGLQVPLQQLRSLSSPGLQFVVDWWARKDYDVDTLAGADQLWLFGDAEDAASAWSDAEAAAILRFMEAGGGVFATGDHDWHGHALCGSLPRLRQLRRWGAGNAGSSQDSIYTIVPVFAASEHDHARKPVFPGRIGPAVHELLQLTGGGAIRWLPDHAHEGNIDTRVQEAAIDSDFRPGGPMVVEYVAWTMAWNLDPVSSGEPRAVPVLKCARPVAADGPGRIVVDSTFHHWVGSNTGTLAQPGHEEALEHWRSYVANLVAFLLPQRRIKALGDGLLGMLRNHTEVKSMLQRYGPAATGPDDRSALGHFVVSNVLARALSGQPMVQRVLQRHLDARLAKPGAAVALAG